MLIQCGVKFYDVDSRTYAVYECSLCKTRVIRRTDHHAKSCGCWSPVCAVLTHETHGESAAKTRSITYKRWDAMTQRCRKNQRYIRKGISVCSEWSSYERFLEDMGPCPSELHTLDRIDNNAGYQKGNCRWATRKEQSRNMSTTRFITAFSKTQCLTDWAIETGININTLRKRLKSMPPQQALQMPVKTQFRTRTK